eukprot:14585226-Ditylum_brightwellii.AAC.1
MRNHNEPEGLSRTVEGLWELSKDHETLVKVYDTRAMQHVGPGKKTARQASHSTTCLTNRMTINKSQADQSGRGNGRNAGSIMVLDDPKVDSMTERPM